MDNGRWKSVIKIVFFAPYPDILPVIEQVFRDRKPFSMRLSRISTITDWNRWRRTWL